MKRHVQAFLRAIGLLERLRSSFWYDLYWRIADPRLIAQRRAEVRFYRDLLIGFRRGDLIFDVGANEGYKTDVFLRLGATVVAVEPDESNQEVIRRKFLRYRFSPKPVVIVGKALGDRNAIETMWIDTPGSAFNTLSPKWVATLRLDERRVDRRLSFDRIRQIETTTLEDLFVSYGVPFFVKIDVEGYEPHVVLGMKRPVPFLSFEVNLPEFRPEGSQCITALGNLDAAGTFNYIVECGRGLELDQWLGPREFEKVFAERTERSIEVFWRSGTASHVGRTL